MSRTSTVLTLSAFLFVLVLLWATGYGSLELYLQQCWSFLVSFFTRICISLHFVATLKQFLTFSDLYRLHLVFVNAARILYDNVTHSIHSAIYPLLSASGLRFLLFDNNAAFLARLRSPTVTFLIDIIILPNNDDAFIAFVSLVPLLLSAIATSDTIARMVKHFTGVAALEQQADAEAYRYTTLKSETEWFASEITHTETTYARKASECDETCEQLSLLQHEQKQSSVRLESVHNAHADVTATIAHLTGETEVCQARCDITATRLQKLNVRVAKLQETAKKQHTALRSAISRRMHVTRRRFVAVEDKKKTTAVLKKDIANARQALEATLATLDTERAALKAEQELLLARQHASKVAHEQQLSDLAKRTSQAAESLAKTKAAVALKNTSREDDMAVAVDRRRALTRKVDGCTSELTYLKSERGELRSEIGSLKDELSVANDNLAQVQDANTASISALATHTAQAHSENIAHQTALEERKAVLTPATAFASRLVADTTASLDFSTAEHRLHMSHCNAASASSAARLANVQARLSTVRSAKDVRAAEVAALRASRTQSEDEQRAELDGLAFRLKSVSTGWAATRGALPEVHAELEAARGELADMRTRNAAALCAYRGLRDVADSEAEGLAKTLGAAQARAAELAAAADARASARDGGDVAALEARRAEEERELKAACAALEEREVTVGRLREELAAIKDAAAGLEGAREDEGRVFSKQLEEATERQKELRSRLAEAGSTHDRKLAGLEERLAALRTRSVTRRTKVEVEVEKWTDRLVDVTAPDFVQGSSREGTPEREAWGQDLASYPVTPALTSGTWSRSPSRSPALPSSLPYECSALVARIVGDDVESEGWDDGEVKPAEVR